MPQFDSKHGEWSFDKRNYQRYLPPSPNPDPDPTPNTIPTPTPNPNPNPNQVPAAQPAAAAPLRPRGGARALQRAARTPHTYRARTPDQQAPGRPATHTCEPRIGQDAATSLDASELGGPWPADPAHHDTIGRADDPGLARHATVVRSTPLVPLYSGACVPRSTGLQPHPCRPATPPMPPCSPAGATLQPHGYTPATVGACRSQRAASRADGDTAARHRAVGMAGRGRRRRRGYRGLGEDWRWLLLPSGWLHGDALGVGAVGRRERGGSIPGRQAQRAAGAARAAPGRTSGALPVRCGQVDARHQSRAREQHGDGGTPHVAQYGRGAGPPPEQEGGRRPCPCRWRERDGSRPAGGAAPLRRYAPSLRGGRGGCRTPREGPAPRSRA